MTEDGRTEDGKWKIEQCSVGPETAIYNKIAKVLLGFCKCVPVSLFGYIVLYLAKNNFLVVGSYM